MLRILPAAVATLLGALALGGGVSAEPLNRTFAFETDKWYSLEDTVEGPVTLHRLEVARQRGLLTKSTLFRPGNAEYLASIEIRLEYSNSGTRDWKARFHLALLDEEGHEIDGYNGREDLNEGERHELVTIKLSTLKYALERARKLRLAIDCEPH